MEILHLNEPQRERFKKTAQAHNQEMAAINQQQGEVLAAFFQQLLPSTSLPDSTALLAVQALEKQKITRTYQHFAEVKALLQEDQIQYFEKFMEKALQIILLEKERPKRKKGAK